MALPTNDALLVAKHESYFKRCLSLLPGAFQREDTSRMTLGFFCLAGLDILGALNSAISEAERQEYIDWVYAQQITPEHTTMPGCCGFQGGPFTGPLPSSPQDRDQRGDTLITASLPSTYSALACLIILGDDLSRVNRPAIIASLKALQTKEGGFRSHPFTNEADLRILYCACVISHLLQDWSGVDQPGAVRYIQHCQGYDGGIGLGPGQESHGGTTYCGVASLKLMGCLDKGLVNKAATMRWCVHRQQQGFHGRINKDDDTCYSFWVGATLSMLDSYHLIDIHAQRHFLLSTQRFIGGFAKYPGEYPDPYHAYFGLTAFSMMNESGIQEIIPELNLTKTSYAKFFQRSMGDSS
ncbi:Geranylgeranyl transferase type-1 subunit beta [Dispira parvispora]|uniref:Geranylgeranyl transferase type-1 subunit beta n=1 Tax=Dispira parvispora TaxID=1520584 RepID=A0A9W8ALT8_9FUNG|nr:Geranylgeranyl transferase type-1 subunit beta [Dispira parvispora]